MRRAFGTAILAAALLGACSSSDDTDGEVSDTPGAPATVTDSQVASEPGDVEDEVPEVGEEPGLQEGRQPLSDVTLLDAGAEPRQLLRLAPDVGVISRGTLRLESRDSISVGAVERESEFVIEVDLEREVLSREADRFEVIVTITDLRLIAAADAVRRGVEEVIEDVVDSSSILWMNSSGQVVDLAQYDAPEFDSPEAHATVVSVLEFAIVGTVPFPEEHVGPGARWSSTRRIVDAGGFDVTRTVTCSLDEITGALVSASLTSESSTAGDGDGRFAGSVVQTGVVTWDLGSPMIVGLETSGDGRYSGELQGQPAELYQEARTVLAPR